MKKITLVLLSSLFVSGALQAQKHKLNSTDEDRIQATLQQSEKQGIPQWELEKLKSLLYRKYTSPMPVQRQGQPQVTSGCTNADFENGDYSGWTLTSGNINGTPLPCYACSSNPGGIANITSSTNGGPSWTNGIDGCTGLPVVAPGGGNCSLALNDKSAGGKLIQIELPIAVTPANAHFSFRYLAVLQDGGSSHPLNNQPYFMYCFLDPNGNIIPSTLYNTDFKNNPSDYTLNASCGAYSRGWINVCIDLTAYIGQNVTFKVQVSDCNQGGHYGYAYIDASCFADQPAVYMCAGSNTQQIIAPSGYTNYQWYGPNNANNAISPPDGTNDTLTITNGQVGDVYYLKDSTALPNGCYGTYSVALQNTNPIWINYSGTHTGTITDTGTVYLCTGDTLKLNAGGTTTYTWSGGVTNGTAFYPSSSDSYTLTGTTSPGCSSTAIIHVVVQSCSPAGISSASLKNGLELYPNPTKGMFTISAENKIDEIRISDITGRIVFECKPGTLSTPIRLENDGIYFVQVRAGSRLSNVKLIVAR